VRFGFRTNLWGPYDGLREALPLIRDAGFAGVEIAQVPDALGPPNEFLGRLDEHGLQLIGLTGGTLEKRMNYLPPDFKHGKNRLEQPYFSLDRWEPQRGQCELAIKEGYRLALHSRYPERATRLDYVWQLLNEQKQLEWLPDTAHLYIAWANVEHAFTTRPERLAGVHVKDWTSIFGHSTYNVAKGFVEPGRGEVFQSFNLWKTLQEADFGEKWLVMEIDYARFSAAQSVWECAKWLADQSARWPASQEKVPVPPSRPFTCNGSNDDIATDILPALLPAATDTPEEFFAIGARLLQEGIPCSATSIWVYNDINDTCVEAACYPSEVQLGRVDSKVAIYFSRKTVEAAYPKLIHMEDSEAGPEDYRAAYHQHGIKCLMIIPVFETYNKHQVRFVLHYSLREPPNSWVQTQEKLQKTAAAFGRVADLYVAELCQRASSRTSTRLDKPEDLRGMFDSLATLIREEIRCDGVSIFRADAAGSELKEAGTTGIDWGDAPLHARKYSSGDGSLTSRVLAERRPFIEINTDGARAELGLNQKSTDIVPPEHESYKVFAFVPFYGSPGRVLGVVRCRNKTRPGGDVCAFTEDDLAVIEAVCRTAAPLLEMRMAAEQRLVTTHRLFHELKAPLGAARGAVHLAQSLVERWAPNLFPQPYLSDAQSWMDLMVRLLNSPIDSKDVLNPQPQRTLLFKDVIIPAARRVADYLKERSLSPTGLDLGKEEEFKVIPPLYVDPNMFQQVFFNLLTNAIKYVANPSHFRVEIRPKRAAEGFRIYFRDWGSGIQEGWAEVIFEEGVRGKNAAQSDVQGRGLGLWLVRQILAKHDCSVWVSSLRSPTELTIFIPKSRIARHQ
jgi:nitrogen-specific signal transduction histidine kinase/sugar phosphate isomerase/epimerase